MTCQCNRVGSTTTRRTKIPISERNIDWTQGTIAMSDALDAVFEAYQRGDIWTWCGEPMLDEVGYYHFHLIDEAFLLTERYGEHIQAELDSFANALDVQVLRRSGDPSGRTLVLLLPTVPESRQWIEETVEGLHLSGPGIALASNDPNSLTLTGF